MTFAEAKDGVTIIIPTRNRPDQLIGVLDNIFVEYQSVDFDVEVFVVCDGDEQSYSNAWLRAAGAEYYGEPEIEPIMIRHEGFRPAMLRNVAAGASHYNQLIFLDDDCRPEDGWLQAYRNAFKQYEDTVFYGPITFIDPETGEEDYAHPVHAARATPQNFWTGNVSIPRKTFFELGGLHPAFDQSGQIGEGAEFGWRAAAAGYDVKCVEDAEVEHRGLIDDENSLRIDEGDNDRTVFKELKQRWKQLLEE